MTLQMSIVKIEIKIPELVKAVDDFKNNKVKIYEDITSEIKSSVGNLFNQILQAEMDIFLGEAEQTNNKRNGHYEHDYALKGVGCIRVRVPRDRNNKFESKVMPKNEQIDPRLKEDLALLHLCGISNRLIALISNRLLGITVSAQTVHNSLDIIEEKALTWLDRKIEKKYWALFVDGTNFKIQRRGSTEKEPTLVVLGIDERNCMSLLSMQPGLKDSSDAWSVVFEDLIKRGLDPDAVQIGVMDGLPGLEKTFIEHFRRSISARCWVHAKKNAIMKCPKKLAHAFDTLLNKVMYASSEADALKQFNEVKKQMQTDAKRAVNCIEKDLPSLLTHYKFDKKYWRTLKTTNPIERVNKELKRRTKTMEGVGEKTLNILLAFTAMKLEYYWQNIPIDSNQLNNLKQVKQQNQMIDVLENLIH